MDADRGLKESQADKALRDLFLEAGHYGAPDGMDARIMQRIAVTAMRREEKPLLPPFAWIAGGVMLAALVAIGLNAAGQPGSLDGWSERMPTVDLSPVFTSPWLMMTGFAATVLLGLDLLLSRRTFALQRNS